MRIDFMPDPALYPFSSRVVRYSCAVTGRARILDFASQAGDADEGIHEETQ